ncbi:MAG: NAD(P)-dependent oxidoreductase [Pseudomonadota bacterium]
MTTPIALIGAGAMGNAIGTRLLETGQRLTVFDIDTEKVVALVDLGATAAASAADAAAASEEVILSLNTAGIVERAVFGDTGVADGATAGTVIIDMSSIAPDATRALAERASAKGLHWVDSPLSGGAPKALIGELTLMLGGESEAFERARDVLSHVASNITHMGPVGSGQTTKLINQVLCALGFAAVAEATKLAEDAGIDAAKIPSALAGGRADSALLQEYMPRFFTRDYRPTGRIDNMVKDLSGALDVANATGTAMPLTAQVAELHKLMVRAGYGGEDQATLMEYFSGLQRAHPS